MMMKRILSLILCVMLVTGIWAMPVLAADDASGPLEQEDVIVEDAEDLPEDEGQTDLSGEEDQIMDAEDDLDEEPAIEVVETDDIDAEMEEVPVCPDGSEMPTDDDPVQTDGDSGTGAEDSAVTSTELPFTDVSTSNWYYSYVLDCYEQGLMNGESATTFAPSKSGTRAAVVTVLYRLCGEPAVSDTACFSDVGSDAWYAPAVAWAYENGLVLGDGDGCFRPTSAVTRQELIVMFYRFAVFIGVADGIEQGDSSSLDAFTDVSSISDWALSAEIWSVEAGLQTGSLDAGGDLSLKPASGVLRSELAAFLVRMTALAEGHLPDATDDDPVQSSGLEVEGYPCASETDQVIDVKASGSTGTLTVYNKDDGAWSILLTTSCYVGKNGITYSKTEGDGKTPAGVYTLGQAFGVASDPGSTRSYLKLTTYHYWVDDSSSVYYNQLVDSRQTGIAWSSAEHLIDYSVAYKYAIAIDYNTSHTAGAGSAIFLHCSTGNATAGCVSVSESVMKTILQSLRDDTLIYIH